MEVGQTWNGACEKRWDCKGLLPRVMKHSLIIAVHMLMID